TPYTDYLQSRREHDAERAEAHVDFWMQYLKGAPEVLDLPSDRPRPNVRSYSAGHVDIPFNRLLTEGVQALSRNSKVSVAMFLCCAWAVFLSRIAGKRDLVIALATPHRDEPESERVVGPLESLFALRVRLDEDLGFLELLRRVRDNIAQTLDHRELPFEKLLEELNPARRLSHEPIFQVAFEFEARQALTRRDWGTRLDVSDLRIPPNAATFDLTLCVRNGDESVEGSIVYATDLFDHSTIERWSESFLALLRGIVSTPHSLSNKLPIMSTLQRRLVLEQFNDTNAAIREDRLIHELIEEQVLRSPQSPAIVAGTRSVTYDTLNREANRLARQLRSKGVGRDKLVALCVGRSAEMVLAMVAVLKAGGAYVPLDPLYPAERLRLMLADCCPALVLTDECGRAALEAVYSEQATASTVIDLEADVSVWADEEDGDLERNAESATPGNLAYVIYTSGSTGVPKGVMLTHRGSVNQYTYYSKQYLSAADRVLVVSAYSFDLTLKNLLAPLFVGATVVLAPNQVFLGQELLELIASTRATVVNCAPSQFYDAVLGLPPPYLRYVVLGGEQIDCRRLSLWLASGGGPTFVNSYGPTEITDVAIDGAVAKSRSASPITPIGRPIANMKVYLLD